MPFSQPPRHALHSHLFSLRSFPRAPLFPSSFFLLSFCSASPSAIRPPSHFIRAAADARGDRRPLFLCRVGLGASPVLATAAASISLGSLAGHGQLISGQTSAAVMTGSGRTARASWSAAALHFCFQRSPCATTRLLPTSTLCTYTAFLLSSLLVELLVALRSTRSRRSCWRAQVIVN